MYQAHNTHTQDVDVYPVAGGFFAAVGDSAGVTAPSREAALRLAHEQARTDKRTHAHASADMRKRKREA